MSRSTTGHCGSILDPRDQILRPCLSAPHEASVLLSLWQPNLWERLENVCLRKAAKAGLKYQSIKGVIARLWSYLEEALKLLIGPVWQKKKACLTMLLPLLLFSRVRADGGIGRHVRLRGVCASVGVQVPLRAPDRCQALFRGMANQIKDFQ